MKLIIEKKYAQIGLTIFLTAFAIILVLYTFFKFDSVKAIFGTINSAMAPVYYALAIAYLITPIMNFFEKKAIIPLASKSKLFMKKSEKSKFTFVRITGVTISLIFVLGFMYLFFASIIPNLYESIKSIIDQSQTYRDNLVNWLNKTMQKYPDIAKMISQLVENVSSDTDDFLNDVILPAINKYLPNATNIVMDISSSLFKFIKTLWNFVLGLVISIYVLFSKEKFTRSAKKITYALFETPKANKIITATRYVHNTFIGFLSGKVIDSIIIGIICFIVCQILGMPYSVLIGFVVGVTNIIPFFGPWFGAIPSGILILMVSPEKLITFIIFILVLQQFDGNILGPKILSGSTGISSFGILFAITVFGGLWGVWGMILGVPLTVVLRKAVKVFTEYRLERKGLPPKSNVYEKVDYIDVNNEFVPIVPKVPKKKAPGKIELALIHLFDKIKAKSGKKNKGKRRK